MYENKCVSIGKINLPTVQTGTNACKYETIDILCTNETKIVKIRTQNAKKVLIKDQVLKIRTLLETVHLRA